MAREGGGEVYTQHGTLANVGRVVFAALYAIQLRDRSVGQSSLGHALVYGLYNHERFHEVMRRGSEKG